MYECILVKCNPFRCPNDKSCHFGPGFCSARAAIAVRSARKNGSPPASRAHSQQSPRESVPLGVQLQPELEPEELPMTQRKSNMSTASRRLATHMAQAAVQRATSDLCDASSAPGHVTCAQKGCCSWVWRCLEATQSVSSRV